MVSSIHVVIMKLGKKINGYKTVHRKLGCKIIESTLFKSQTEIKSDGQQVYFYHIILSQT